MMASMSVESDSYDDLADVAAVVGSRNQLRVVEYLRENPAAYYSDILDGTDVPRGSLGRVLHELVERGVLTIDVQPEKRGTGRNFRYTVNENRVRQVLARLESILLGG